MSQRYKLTANHLVLHSTVVFGTVLLVLQERDGCLNVLKSYKLDSGVDALLRKNMSEVRATVC